MAVSGDTAVVGAYLDDTPAGADAGSAYVFVRSGGTWTQQQKLTAPDAAAGDRFGFSVAVSGDTVVVGAYSTTRRRRRRGLRLRVRALGGHLDPAAEARRRRRRRRRPLRGLGGGLGRHRGGGRASATTEPRARRMCSSSRAESRFWVANRSANRVTRYAAGATGNAAPAGLHRGGGHRAERPTGVAVDGGGRLYVANQTANSVTVYAPERHRQRRPAVHHRRGRHRPVRPRTLALDTSGRLYVANAPATR